ncbi:hypothetical protein [Nocardia sp. NPDC048505]|uniref:hypothetical protein n=1 Tax=unclassified Nocardia TaxID=2637762 RepID=UPI003407293A
MSVSAELSDSRLETVRAQHADHANSAPEYYHPAALLKELLIGSVVPARWRRK